MTDLLLPAEAADTDAAKTLKDGHYMPGLDLQLIVPWELNPRKAFDQAPLDELAESIRMDGVQQPIVVRLRRREDGNSPSPSPLPSPEGEGEVYQIVMGERRWRASALAGKRHIPAIIRVDLDDKTAMRLAVVENCKRKDLNPIEEASSYLSMSQMGFSQAEIAESVGVDPSLISNRLRLLKLPETVQQLVIAGKLSATHARALLRFEKFPAVMQKIADLAMIDGTPAKALENGLPFGHALENAKLAKSVDWHTVFDKRICLACPLSAYVTQTEYGYAWCLAPEEYARKQAEAIERERTVEGAGSKEIRAQSAGVIEKLREMGRTVEETFATRTERPEDSAADLLVKSLPKMLEMPAAAYLSLERGVPEGCTEACSCRAMALNFDDVPTPICTDIGCVQKLFNAARKKKEEAANAAIVREKMDRVTAIDRDEVVASSALASRFLAIAADAAIEECSDRSRAEMAKEFELSDPETAQLLKRRRWHSAGSSRYRTLEKFVPKDLLLLVARLKCMNEAQYYDFTFRTEVIDYVLDGTVIEPKSREEGIGNREEGAADGPECARCGCTEEHACDEGCSWVHAEGEKPLCSRCTEGAGGQGKRE